MATWHEHEGTPSAMTPMVWCVAALLCGCTPKPCGPNQGFDVSGYLATSCSELAKAATTSGTSTGHDSLDASRARLIEAFELVTGKRADVKLAEDIPAHGAFRPTAVTCTRTNGAPVVYVTRALVDRIADLGEDSEHTFAFILGHELGHVTNNFTAQHTLLSNAEVSRREGVYAEALADTRSALYMTLAGYDSLALADASDSAYGYMAEYLLEKGEDDPRLKTRRRNLERTLRLYPAVDMAYRSARAAVLTHQSGDLAADMLEVVEGDLVRGAYRHAGVRITAPELGLMRALAKISWASTRAPWRAQADRLSESSLVCSALSGARSVFAPSADTRGGREMGPAEDEMRAAVVALGDAEELLRALASTRGLEPSLIENAMGCVELYRGNYEAARVRFTELSRGPKGAASSRVGAQNIGLTDLMAHLDTLPGSDDVAPEALVSHAQAGAWMAHPGVKSYLQPLPGELGELVFTPFLTLFETRLARAFSGESAPPEGDYWCPEGSSHVGAFPSKNFKYGKVDGPLGAQYVYMCEGDGEIAQSTRYVDARKPGSVMELRVASMRLDPERHTLEMLTAECPGLTAAGLSLEGDETRAGQCYGQWLVASVDADAKQVTQLQWVVELESR